MPHDLVNWKDFDKLIMIRKFRDLIARWWNIQIHFTDKKGLLRGVPSGKFFNPQNPISQAIVENNRGFAFTMEDVKKTTIEASLSKKPKVVRNASGFSALFVPLKVSGENLGCVFADGFIREMSADDQKNQIRSFLSKVFGVEADHLFQHIDKLPQLSETDVNYLCELIKMVASEMLETQAILSTVQKKVAKLEGELRGRFQFSSLIGQAENMQKLYNTVEKVCNSDATVLIRGENGTGKELFARALHYNSHRKNKKMLTVNCGAFNDNLLESELFGHVKGAFTGATRNKKGVFEEANGGTLFLDEIGDTSTQMQVKLLRVLQEGTFIPVGSTETKKTQVRVIAATNRHLEQMIEDNLFREDLFYRLHVILLEIPPLRDRKEDIPILIEHFLKKYSNLEGEQSRKLSSECLKTLLNHNWPGNVRELENEIQRLCVLSDAKEIQEDLISNRIQHSSAQNKTHNHHITLKSALEKLEREIIESALSEKKSITELADELDISEKELKEKIQVYNLQQRNIQKAS